MAEDFAEFLPLSAAALHILLALASEERHRYGMMREGARQSEDRCKLGPGTRYDKLPKLLHQGIVEACSPRAAGDEPGRRYDRRSRFGRGLLATEIARLEGVVREARPHRKIRPEKA